MRRRKHHETPPLLSLLPVQHKLFIFRAYWVCVLCICLILCHSSFFVLGEKFYFDE